MNRRDIVFFTVTVLGVIADQATKWWVIQNIPLGTGEISLIPGWLSLVHAQNPGAAFGILRDFEYRHLVFAGFSVIAMGVILDMYRKLPKRDLLMSLTLGLLLSGAVGNAIDRVRLRVVTDFIRVYTEHPTLKPWLIEQVNTYEWPSFNIADANLVVGVILYLIVQSFFDDSNELQVDEGEKPAAS